MQIRIGQAHTEQWAIKFKTQVSKSWRRCSTSSKDKIGSIKFQNTMSGTWTVSCSFTVVLNMLDLIGAKSQLVQTKYENRSSVAELFRENSAWSRSRNPFHLIDQTPSPQVNRIKDLPSSKNYFYILITNKYSPR